MPHEDALRNVDLFSRFANKDLTRLGRAVVERTYKTGQTIFKEGDQAVALFIVTSGKVEISQSVGSKKSQVLATFGPADPFGDMALLDGLPRSATATAVQDTTCLVLSRWDFVAELQTNPHMAVAMLPVLSHRLRAADAKLAATH